MTLETALEALIQLREGKDIPAPRQVLSRIKPEDACRVLPMFRKSIADYVWHADFWQQIWIARLSGEPARSMMEDWQSVEPADWEATRERFLANLDRAVEIARSGEHRMKDDATANRLLLQIAIHNSYHIGQWVLIKRALRLARAADTAAQKSAKPSPS